MSEFYSQAAEVAGIGQRPFVKGYIEALYFTDSGEDRGEFDAESPMAEEAVKAIVEECEDFINSNSELLEKAYASIDEERAGQLFWYNRNGHGVGFWDQGYEPFWEELSKASKPYGDSYTYLGDDGKVYVQ